MKKNIRLAGLLLPIVFCGCIATPQSPVRPAVPPLRQLSRAGIDRRCAQLKRLLAPLEVRGIALFHRAFEVGYSPGEVCRFIKACGFNRVYFNITSEVELDDKLKNFLVAAESCQLPVEIVIRQGNFHPRSRGNYLLQNIRPAYPLLPDAVSYVVKYNKALPPEAGRIDGITVIAEPHKFTASHAGIGQIFVWDEASFGPGCDNDMLVRETFEKLAALQTDGLPLTIGFSDFYHELAVSGKITKGRITDFIKAASPEPRVMILSTASKPSDVVKGTLNELISSAKDHKVLLGIELSDHASLAGQKLRRRDWNDLVRILTYVIREHRKHPEFKGLMISPLAVFEFLIMEQE